MAEGGQETWSAQIHDAKLKRLLQSGEIELTCDRAKLIQVAKTHFPTTIGTSKASIDNRVKLLRRRINAYRIGLSKEGQRKQEGKNPVIISLYHFMVHVSQFYPACYFFRKTVGCINHALPNTKGNVAESDDSEDLEASDIEESSSEEEDDSSQDTMPKPTKKSTKKSPKKPTLQPDDAADLVNQMSRLSTRQFTRLDTYAHMPTMMGEETVDANGVKHLNVQHFGFASLHTPNYVVEVVQDGWALSTRVLLPARFFNIERFFEAYGLDPAAQASWMNPNILCWLQTVAYVREKYPDATEFLPSDPPMKYQLSEQVEERIVSRDFLWSEGCYKVYQDMAAMNGG